MNKVDKLRQEYRGRVGSTYNMKYELYASWLETELLILRHKVKNNVVKRNVIESSYCECDDNRYFDLKKGKRVCVYCKKEVK